MDNVKNDLYYLSKLKDNLEFLTGVTSGLTIEQFSNDQILQDCVLFRIIQISENAERLSPAFKDTYSSIPWRKIKGMRNRIVHEYSGVKLDVVYSTIMNDIPSLNQTIGIIWKNLDANNKEKGESKLK